MKHNNSTAGFFLCRKLHTLSLVCIAVAVSSCTLLYDAFGDTETITFSMPESFDASNTDVRIFPTGNPPTLMWIDANGSVRREPISALVEEFPERQTSISITVSKGLVTPVLLFCDGLVHPEGFIYPYEAEFTEAGGFAAHILYRLIHESDGDKNAVRLYCAHFNWQKFLQSVRKLDDPWQCDQTLILQSIADGTFKANTLKTRANQTFPYS